MRLRTRALTAVAVAVTVATAPLAQAAPWAAAPADRPAARVAEAPTESTAPAKVTGPVAVTADSHPFLSTDVVKAYDYVEEEFFVEGVAFDHIFRVDSPYRTRIVVRRPTSAAKANGAVVLEWNNVTGGYDQEYEWFTSHDYFMRTGTTWVGVSNQYVGVNDLKRVMPQRYGSLVFAGDGASEDVFSQTAQALLAPRADGPDPLAGMRPEVLLAAGHSQSGTKLAGYYNVFQPRLGLFDGFMVRGIEEAVRTDDVKVPLLRVQTETDATEGSRRADVDGPHYRRWDVAGASHVDKQQVTYKDPLVLRDRGSQTPLACLTEPYSRVPFGHVLNAAYDAMLRWVRTGTPPPVSPRFTANALDVITRDARGNALGGIQLPHHAAPTATNTGDNVGVGFCVLYGSHQAFDQATLRSLYATHGQYVDAVERVAEQRVAEGFLLPADARATVAQAKDADLGLPRAKDRDRGRVAGTATAVEAPAPDDPV